MTAKRFELNNIVKKGTVSFWDNKKQKVLNASHSLDLLNELADENEQLKLELNSHKHPLWSTREAERKVSELTDLLCNETTKNAILLKEINSLRKENMRFKELRKYD